MRTYRSKMMALLGGIVITLLAGLYARTIGGFTTTAWHGLPLPWISQTLTTTHAWSISAVGLIADIVVWMIVIDVIYFAKKTMESDVYRESASR
ncbi:MAG: hypothetical protein KGH94_03785 [Candidatus Micrarchaeota archaeon]|nr:hypothetical protein [Candidatus Micrarchaeota archaeon]